MSDPLPARKESTADILARVDRWAAEGRVGEALAACRALAARLDAERGRLEAGLLRRRASDRSDGARPRRESPPPPPAAAEDPLTGLASRAQLDASVARLARQQPDAPPTLLMVDIDHFRRINDGRSRAIGDAVLEQLAQLLRAQSRPQDLLARLGGDQFAVAFGSAVSLTRALLVAERLRAAIEHHDWSTLDAGLAVSASIGVAACAPGEALETALARAASALAECKRNGRNQVRCAS